MLRAIPPLFGSQFPGVVVMGGAIAILFVLPWLDRSPVKSIRYKGMISKVMLVIFCVSFVILGYLGVVASSPERTIAAQICTALYFLYFFAMPFYTKMESTKPVPERVTG
jgi:ubiquinol-cytochrome c reductase cytochrome b subunit